MAITSPAGGVHYPRNLSEMTAWFATQEACLDYLAWLRWPDGIVCGRCGAARGWNTSRGDWVCAECKGRTSVLAGTVFERTRVELPHWFLLAWHMTNAKTAGISAAGAQRLLALGSYQTAWTMLHKLRSAMVRPDRTLLRGDVEVDETFVGGSRSGGKPGRGAPGKVPVAVAVEVKSPKGFGRARLEVIPDAKRVTLHRFICETIEPGSCVLTDGLAAYRGIDVHGYTHKPFVVDGSGVHAHVPLPGVHRVASLFKRSLLNAYQSYPKLHLQAYCDEWVFRFNRRSSTHRGQLFLRLLECAVAADPLPYKDLAASARPRAVSPQRPANPGRVHRPAVNVAQRPWRGP